MDTGRTVSKCKSKLGKDDCQVWKLRGGEAVLDSPPPGFAKGFKQIAFLRVRQLRTNSFKRRNHIPSWVRLSHQKTQENFKALSISPMDALIF